MLNTLTSVILSASLLLTPASTARQDSLARLAKRGGPIDGGNVPIAGEAGQLVENYQILASESMDLSNRYPVESISEGFKENILIALAYLASQGEALRRGLAETGLAFLESAGEIDFAIILQPGEVFAFHNKGILPEFKASKIVSQESDFTTNYGYKVVAGLGGNGVCHLASLMNLTALKADLEVTAPTNHNFDRIPGIDKEYGVSISTRNSPERQNLYIKNNLEFPVFFRFELRENNLVFSIVRQF